MSSRPLSRVTGLYGIVHYRYATTLLLPYQYRIDTALLPPYNEDMSILKDKRELQALSQQDLASKSGVAKSTIVRIENGQHKPNWVTIRKLAGALECDVSGLVHLRQERERQSSDETTDIEQRNSERHRRWNHADWRDYQKRTRAGANGTG